MTTNATIGSTSLEDLLDRDELHRLVSEVGRCLDDGDFEGLRAIYTTDATASTPGGRVAGIDALVDQARRSHTRSAGVQHLITDVLVELDGDEAAIRANLQVTFTDASTPPAPTFQLGEVYRFTARRQDAGWRLSSVASTPVWAVGERP